MFAIQVSGTLVPAPTYSILKMKIREDLTAPQRATMNIFVDGKMDAELTAALRRSGGTLTVGNTAKIARAVLGV